VGKYFGQWDSREGLVRDFAEPGIPADEQILFAEYASGSYKGYATVVFVEDGVPYLVEASHCSCYGLEGFWEPERVTWPMLAQKKFSYVEEGTSFLQSVIDHYGGVR
jgi:hypothetical protein